jgi:hypothetical protein
VWYIFCVFLCVVESRVNGFSVVEVLFVALCYREQSDRLYCGR